MITNLGQLPNVILLLSIVLVLYYLNNGELNVAFNSRSESLVDAILSNLTNKVLQNKNVQKVVKHLNNSRTPEPTTSNLIHMNHFDATIKNNPPPSPTQTTGSHHIGKEFVAETPCIHDNAIQWDTMIDIEETDFVKQEKLRVPVYSDPITTKSSRTNDNLCRLNAAMLGGDTDQYTGTIEDLYDEIVKGS